ncbi:MAG: hypothetical protein U0572_14745 [Phycisphaerales bacterium]
MLAVRAVQGTKDGPAVAGDEAEVLFFQGDRPVKQIKTILDEQGLLLIDDLPVGLGLRPLVRIKHGGVFYQNVGATLDANRPKGSMDVTVYEVTDNAPPWTIVMRHIVATRAHDGLDVSEMVVVNNPTDRTWLGAPPAPDGRRTTVTVALPASAADVQLERGFHGWCCTAFDRPVLAVQMPFMPGEYSYRFAYHVPLHEGAADLRVSAPATTQRAAIFVPDAGERAEPANVNDGGIATDGDLKAHMFTADAVPASTPFGVSLSGFVTAATAPAASTAPVSTGSSAAFWVLGSLVAVLLFFVVVKVFQRSTA